MIKYSIILFTPLLILIFTQPRKININGVWKIVEVKTVKPNGTFTSNIPLESQAIFANNYYSFCWSSHINSNRNWQMSDSVKLSRFNQSIINAGTFEIKDAVLTTKATFAINPMFVNGIAKFKCSFLGDTLVLTGLSVNSSEGMPNPIYVNGSHFVTKLIKISDNK